MSRKKHKKKAKTHAKKKANLTPKPVTPKAQKAPKEKPTISVEELEQQATRVQTRFEKIVQKTKNLAAQKKENLQQNLKPLLVRGAYYITTIIAAVAILVTIEVQANGRIFPKTTAGNVEIGYLPLGQAHQELDQKIQNFLQHPLYFTLTASNGEITTVEVMPQELDLQIQLDQTLARLPSFSLKQHGPPHLIAALFSERFVPLSQTFNTDKAIKVLEEKFQLTNKKTQNARLMWQDSDFHIQPEVEGIAIDRQELVAQLRTTIGKLSTKPVALKLNRQSPVLTATDLEEQKENLLALLQTPIYLQNEDASLSIKLLDHLDAVTLTKDAALQLQGQNQSLPLVLHDSGINLAHAQPIALDSTIQLQLDPDKLKDHLTTELIEQIEKPASPASIYTNQDGQVIIDGTGENGRTVPLYRLVKAIELAANHNIHTVPIPVLSQKAPLTIAEDLQELGITELIATGHSAYYGSPMNRMFNIDHGTQKYNGLLIAPGEEFSFNEHLGPVDATSGFKPEKVIKGNKIEIETGGGICQVSTTMYRAALLAGLPITERKPHSWKVSYYGQSMGHGLDATIYPGVVDLKFTNDTPGHLLIQAYTDGAEAYFKIYGTNDGRQTTMEGPFGSGLTYQWNRTVLDAQGNPINEAEEIWSRYRPIPPDPPPEPPEVTEASRSDSLEQTT